MNILYIIKENLRKHEEPTETDRLPVRHDFELPEPSTNPHMLALTFSENVMQAVKKESSRVHRHV